MDEITIATIADFLMTRIHTTSEHVGVFYERGTFRVAPATGPRFAAVVNDFPDMILGVYNKDIKEKDFSEDLLYFCRCMGFETDECTTSR